MHIEDELKISKADIEDLQEILNLQYLAYQSEAALFGSRDIPPLKQTLDEVIEEYHKGIILKLVDTDNLIIGSIRAWEMKGTIYIGKLMIHPNYRQRGYGTKLLSEIEKYYPQKRYELFTSTRSIDNIRLYQRMGYRVFGHRRVDDKLEFVYLEKNQMQLRPFNPDDAETILSWCKDKTVFRKWSADRYPVFPPKPEDMAVQYAADNIFPFTAVDGEGNIVGHIILRYPESSKTIIRLGFVVIDDQLRGKGYGKQMLQLAIKKAQQEFGAKKITLGVFDNNPSALHCYESVGFVVTGTDTYAIDGEEWTEKEMEFKPMQAVLYIHGKGGSATESEHYQLLFPDSDMIGLDYHTFTPWETGKEIREAVADLKTRYKNIILIANSIGAFFSMNAGIEDMIQQAYFISPIVDMVQLITNMMTWANVTELELKSAGFIHTEFGEDLSWDYLCYVRSHPVSWYVPTHILYGSSDQLTSIDTISNFANEHHASLTIMDGGEHWFHTKEQLQFLDNWMITKQKMK